MARTFRDFFSADASTYARHRPRYPAELHDYLARVAPARGAVWDCATGNGQAAVDLAERFERVYATDASSAQIAEAQPHPRVTYAVATAETSGLPSNSVDLVVVAQALHWFRSFEFFSEARRVLRPGGIVAAWGYAYFHCGDPGIDTLLDETSHGRLGPYWQPEPKHLWNGYADVPWPFEEVAEPLPRLRMEVEWTLEELVGHVTSWSATRTYRDAHEGAHPLEPVFEALRAAWGGPERVRRFSAPLVLRVGKA